MAAHMELAYVDKEPKTLQSMSHVCFRHFATATEQGTSSTVESPLPE